MSKSYYNYSHTITQEADISMPVIVWNMLHDGVAYDELGIDHYDKTNPERARKRLQRRMVALGFEPNLTPLSAGSSPSFS